ncbi:MAG: electron transfer flavoprotein [Fusobacterium sp.]|uniref:electron transfer flavoprotein n=1 Tax=Fusobacterium sp. TaxID=68766 RepID=UPI0026DCA99A|nr:electron transfer flavoprotein [Fusobacterium sp.]MDO4690175.1 electron transfer flavoprotein [Fusobacterium sp.]
MRKIIVIIRETFPTNEVLTKENIKEKFILNPYDEYALLQARKIKEKVKTEIICLFLSKRKSQYNLRTALALGADRGIFFLCQNMKISEIAKNIANEIQKEKYDDIFMGIRDVNNDRGELPSHLALLLNQPLYSHILSVDYSKNYIAIQEKDESIDTLKIENSGIFAFSQNVYEAEYPSIMNILSIQNKEIKTIKYINKKIENNTKVIYQDRKRKQIIYKDLNSQEGTLLLLEYLQKWKLVD